MGALFAYEKLNAVVPVQITQVQSPMNESAAGGANNRMRLTGAAGAGCTNAFECIRYTLTNTTTGTGTGLLNNISFGVAGSTGIADYQSAAVGSYTDTVTLTVSP